jgi:hypothetical protein
MVEVDVREHEMPDVGQREAPGGESQLERVEAGRRPAVDERRLVARQQVRRNDLALSQVQEVEWLDRST